MQQGHCHKVRPVVEQVVSIMTVPLVQGTLRYAYKVGNKAVNTVAGQAYKVGNVVADQTAKNAAEGSTFAAAVLPMVNYCNAASATIVANHMKFGLVFDTTTGKYVSGTVPDFAAVKSALEAVYQCFGITCAHVGALGGVIPTQTATAAKCTDPTTSVVAWTAPSSPAPAAKITGAKKVSVEVKAAGDVSAYEGEDGLVKKAALEAVMAKVATALKDKTLASTALGVTVEAVPTVAVG